MFDQQLNSTNIYNILNKICSNNIQKIKLRLFELRDSIKLKTKHNLMKFLHYMQIDTYLLNFKLFTLNHK